MQQHVERNQDWLELRLTELWEEYFPDIHREPHLQIKFGAKAKHRLGSIKRRNGISLITLTGYFRDPAIPECVIDETIVHELVHYSHGFESPLPRLYRYPHEGGIINREMAKRGLSIIHRNAKRWLKQNWATYTRGHGVARTRKPARRTLLIPLLRRSIRIKFT